jgi:glycosyltransferase involved in cell wall biosynthesis
LLAGAQGFVLPSLNENLPMALLEAMAMGLPVVVTAVGAMPEVVRNGVEGLIVPADAAEALAEALDALARQPQLRAEMGDAAAQRCHSLYGIERMVESLISIYAELGRCPS